VGQGGAATGGVSTYSWNGDSSSLSVPATLSYYGSFFSSGRIVVTTSTAFSFGATANDFTIEASVMWPATAGVTQSFLDLNGGTRIILGRTTSGWRVYINGAEAGFTFNIASNFWYHFVFLRYSGTYYIYVNGSLMKSAAETTTWAFTSLTVGTEVDGGSTMAGYVSNLRILKGSAAYTAAFIPPTGALTVVNNTQLLTLQNATFIDNSSNNFSFTQTSSPTIGSTYTRPVGVTAYGGGGGGGYSASNGWGGASGGGGGQGTTPGAGLPGQGNAGGGVGGGDYSGGGGGGAGGVGQRPTGTNFANGGLGGTGTQSSITGTPTYYGGGGGGSTHGSGTVQSTGGAGGGGAGRFGATLGQPGTPNTGGGGGGGSENVAGGIGGSGVVIIKIPNQYAVSFTTSTTYTVSSAVSGYNIYRITAGSGLVTAGTGIAVEYLIVGGGGAGGAGVSTNARGGGGGAGGLLYQSDTIVSGSSNTITIGAGGTTVVGQNGTNGGNTVAFANTMLGGGGGGSWGNSGTPNSGASGGGAGQGSGSVIGGTSTQFATYGYGVGFGGGTNGGAYTNNNASSGGGGGGSGGAGNNASAGVAGAGGTGTNAYSTFLQYAGAGVYSTGTFYIAGGGGGGGGTAIGRGGIGGGGDGAYATDTPSDATIFTGSGGGGGGGSGGGTGVGGAGASGIVIVRYPSGINNDILYNNSDPYFNKTSLLLSNPQTVSNAPTIDYLVVAGGGGGGGAGSTNGGSGGGGAGGLLTASSQTFLLATLYTVTVGTGGNGGARDTNGSNGSNSIFSTLTAIGGGGGAGGTSSSGNSGGSGGGGGQLGGTGGSATSGQGNAGATTVGNNNGGQGGGGAGAAVSADTVTNQAGNGGTGTFTTLISTTTAIALGIGQYVTATNAIYFAGGGGGGNLGSNGYGLGGTGGGGAGSPTGGTGGVAGTANTGGGGGGGQGDSPGPGTGGRGGSGVVLLRVPNTHAAYFSSGITASATTATGYNIYAVTSGTGTVLFGAARTETILLDYLIVAGGGGGGANDAAGGGAGGVLTTSGFNVLPGFNYAVVVGAGGAGAVNNAQGTSGNDSVFSALRSYGGGGGGADAASNAAWGFGKNGGSGGGGGGGSNATTPAGGSGVAGQGNAGGAGGANQPGGYGGGGGGGWGAAGTATTSGGGGNGGAGSSSTIFVTTGTAISATVGQYVTATNAIYFGGGGGGGSRTVPGTAGIGGGGTGTGSGGGAVGGSAQARTGGGGGGASNDWENAGQTGTGGAGGSGAVVLRHLTSVAQTVTTTGSPSIATAGAYTIYAFTSSGSIQISTNPPAVATTNTSFIDSSVNALTITPTGTPTQGTFNPFGTNWSNYFNGSSNLTIPTNAALNFSTGDFTIEAWIYRTLLGTDYYIISGSGTGGLGFGFTSTGANLGWVRAALAWDYSYAHGMSLNTWYHVALTRSGTSMRLFVNGTQIGVTQTLATAYDLGIGSTNIGSEGANYYFNGYISNLRVLKGTALYTSNFTPATAPLPIVTNTSLLTCANNRFMDKNSTATFTAAGTPSVQRFTPFPTQTYAYNTVVNNGSAYFNGTTDYLSMSGAISLTGQFSVECWFNNTNVGGTQRTIFAFNSVAASYGSIRVDCDASGTANVFQLLLSTNGTSWASITTGAYVKNMWNHLVITRDASNVVRLFINGSTAIASFTQAGTLYNASSVHGIGINGLPGSASNFYLGYISNLRLINGSIPSQYQTAITTSGTLVFTPPAAPLFPLDATTSTSVLLNFTNPAIYDATMNNDVITAGTSALSTAVTKFNSRSMKFNGTSDYLSIPINPLFGFGTGDFTVEFWFYQTSVVTTEMEIWEAQTTNAFAIYKATTSGALSWRPYAGTDQTILAHASIPINTWTHVAVCRASGVTKAFVNGMQVNSVADTTNYATPTVVYTLGGRNAGSNYFPGYIDDFRITKFARYTANFLPPTAVPLLK